MSITLAGLLVTFSGIAVVIVGLLVIPETAGSFKYVVVAIGWVFIIVGIVVRIYGMRMERKIEEMKKQHK